MNNILKFDKQETIDMSDLRNSLIERGIHFDKEEIEHLFNSLKFSDNNTGVISRLEIYANAHLFRIDNSLRTDLMQKIAIGCGVGLTENDL
jgi:hypothetical protein